MSLICVSGTFILYSPEPDKLMYLIYEKVKLKGGKIDPHLWSYRPHITLEHLALGLAQQNLKEKCKVLQIFLDEVSSAIMCVV